MSEGDLLSPAETRTLTGPASKSRAVTWALGVLLVAALWLLAAWLLLTAWPAAPKLNKAVLCAAVGICLLLMTVFSAKVYAMNAPVSGSFLVVVVAIMFVFAAVSFCVGYRALHNLGHFVEFTPPARQAASAPATRPATSPVATGTRCPPPPGRALHTFAHLMYFSCVTGTTLGYGDARPADWATRTLAAAQASAFWLYFAFMVGSMAARRPESLPDTTPGPDYGDVPPGAARVLRTASDQFYE